MDPVLSLTWSSLGREHNWSAFERVHTKKINNLQQMIMNDVCVMTNSRLNKKKDVRKINDYNIDDLAFDDKWLVENETNSYLDALDEDILVEVGEDDNGSSGASVIVDNLEVPLVIELDVDEGGGDAIDEDDYPIFSLNNILV
ncbi:hypothetical protein CR513_23797, partial [Mucuna pruriens]